MSENTVSLNLSDVRNAPSGKVLNGHLYNGVAVEETDSDIECYHGKDFFKIAFIQLIKKT